LVDGDAGGLEGIFFERKKGLTRVRREEQEGREQSGEGGSEREQGGSREGAVRKQGGAGRKQGGSREGVGRE
jgi:hypothetical protein